MAQPTLKFSIEDLVITQNADGTESCKFKLVNTKVEYANTLRRLILTGVEAVAFRSDINDKGQSSDVVLHSNSTPMTNEMLADRIGLLPITWDWKEFGTPRDYVFSIDVKNTTQDLMDVTSNMINVKKMIAGAEPEVVPEVKKNFFAKDILIAVLKPTPPGRTDEVSELKLTAVASTGIGREHARFIPVSQCSYRYTRDTTGSVLEDAMKKWIVDMKKLVSPNTWETISEEKQAALRLEFNTMEADRCYLKDADGEAMSFDFEIETIGTMKVIDIVDKALERAVQICQRYARLDSDDRFPANMKPPVPPPNRLDGFDFVFTTPSYSTKDADEAALKVINKNRVIDKLSSDHTLGNLLQTYIVDQIIPSDPKITYAGYMIPHPLREEMLLRIGVKDKNQKDARAAIAMASAGCAAMFAEWQRVWREKNQLRAPAPRVIGPAIAQPKRKSGIRE